MKYFIFFMTMTTLLISAEAELPKKFAQIGMIKSSTWDGKQVWVKGVLTNKDTDDIFFLEDESGSIILFLPTDELMNMGLKVGNEVEVFGTLDCSSVSSNKTELDADKIIVKPKSPNKSISTLPNK